MIKKIDIFGSTQCQKGFSILEVLLASTMFVIFASAAMVAVIGGFTANRIGQENSIATQFASEGLEAVRSIRNQGFSNLEGLPASDCSTGTGVAVSGGVWTLSGSSNTLTSDPRFTRIIKICDSQRIATASSNLGLSGTTYKNVKKVTSTVTWSFGSGHTSSVALTTYLSNWRTKKGGMLVYGSGGSTSNAVSYKTYNASTDTWSAVGSTASVGQSTAAALQIIKVYASATRNEKIAISRHYDSTAGTQAIYAQVYNGIIGTWGNAVKLSQWTAATFLDVRNFGGAYLGNGDFIAVYSDNTATPKFATWNGTSWNNTGVSMQSLGTSTHIPVYVVVHARPGTNEVMAGFTDQANSTSTEYFNGGTYVATNWSAATAHATSLTINTKELIDFGWITDTQGTIVYSAGSSGTASKVINTKIFTANGTGGGSWGSVVTSPQVSGTNAAGALNLDTRQYVAQFVTCNKTSGNQIVCFESNTTPTWTSPTNNTITTSTDTGIERSYDISYEAISGALGVIVYSDTTTIPKLKKYDPVANSFDAAAINLTALAGNVTGVRSIPQPAGDDIMFLLYDTNKDVYTAVWDGTNNVIYAAGGKSSTLQGNNGASTTEFWANFAWDNY